MRFADVANAAAFEASLVKFSETTDTKKFLLGNCSTIAEKVLRSKNSLDLFKLWVTLKNKIAKTIESNFI